MHLPVSISNEISEFFTPHFEENPEDYVCIYGSSVYSSEKETSDVDMFVVTHNAGALALGPTVDFIQDLHRRHGRTLDAEVPYENKVHYTATEMDAALRFGGFEVNGQHISVPTVRKEPSFLNSPAIKARLALNGLTTPHSAVGVDFNRYHANRAKAGEAITLLAISLCDEEAFTIPDLHHTLTTDRQGASGEMYLGYKTEYPVVAEHLSGVLSGALGRLTEHGVVSQVGDGFIIDRRQFDPLGYMTETMPREA